MKRLALTVMLAVIAVLGFAGTASAQVPPTQFELGWAWGKYYAFVDKYGVGGFTGWGADCSNSDPSTPTLYPCLITYTLGGSPQTRYYFVYDLGAGAGGPTATNPDPDGSYFSGSPCNGCRGRVVYDAAFDWELRILVGYYNNGGQKSYKQCPGGYDTFHAAINTNQATWCHVA